MKATCRIVLLVAVSILANIGCGRKTVRTASEASVSITIDGPRQARCGEKTEWTARIEGASEKDLVWSTADRSSGPWTAVGSGPSIRFSPKNFQVYLRASLRDGSSRDQEAVLVVETDCPIPSK